MHRRRIQYIIVLAATVAAVVLYIDRREIQARFHDSELQRQTVEEKRAEVEDLERRLAEAEQTTQGLEDDPLEVEAAIRQVNRGVRENEIMYRIEVAPEERSGESASPMAGTHAEEAL